ncbi:MAG TPA: aminoglycoside phosphotransferase family protein [Micromonosporaceae bacterium]
MAASKNRLRWHQVPEPIQAEVARLAQGVVVSAHNCPGGFSPGLASRLGLADGRRVFVKAMDADAWPHGGAIHRLEAIVAAALPVVVPAPRLQGVFDDGHWVVLVFEDIDGTEPVQPWRDAQLRRVVAALDQMACDLTGVRVTLPPRDDPMRLGGWAEVAADRACLDQVERRWPWAAALLDRLIEWERVGQAAAETGDSLVHFDAYPHNTLLTAERVVLVDWPHARLGNPLVDLVQLLSSAAADGLDPEPYVVDRPRQVQSCLDAILAAHAGFLLSGGLSVVPPGLEAIPKAKLRLGIGALSWLRRRMASRAGGRLVR